MPAISNFNAIKSVTKTNARNGCQQKITDSTMFLVFFSCAAVLAQPLIPLAFSGSFHFMTSFTGSLPFPLKNNSAVNITSLFNGTILESHGDSQFLLDGDSWQTSAHGKCAFDCYTGACCAGLSASLFTSRSVSLKDLSELDLFGPHCWPVPRSTCHCSSFNPVSYFVLAASQATTTQTPCAAGSGKWWLAVLRGLNWSFCVTPHDQFPAIVRMDTGKGPNAQFVELTTLNVDTTTCPSMSLFSAPKGCACTP